MKFELDEFLNEYLTDLPDEYVRLPDLWQLFTLIDKNAGRTKENMQIRSGITLLIFNPQTGVFYPRYLCQSTDREALYKYFKDNNLYIDKKDIVR